MHNLLCVVRAGRVLESVNDKKQIRMALKYAALAMRKNKSSFNLCRDHIEKCYKRMFLRVGIKYRFAAYNAFAIRVYYGKK